MGVAYGFGLKFGEAVESLKEAIAVLEKRIQNLKEDKASQGEDLLQSYYKVLFLLHLNFFFRSSQEKRRFLHNREGDQRNIWADPRNQGED